MNFMLKMAHVESQFISATPRFPSMLRGILIYVVLNDLNDRG